MYLKIINLIDVNGAVDYKGLDLNFIKGGTQKYDLINGIAYFFYESEDLVSSEDVFIVNKEEYDSFSIEEETQSPFPDNQFKDLEDLALTVIHNREMTEELETALYDLAEMLAMLLDGGGKNE